MNYSVHIAYKDYGRKANTIYQSLLRSKVNGC